MRTLLKVLAVVVVVAGLAVTGYLVFRDDPGGPDDSWEDEAVAAYVGEVAIAEEQLDAVIAELRAAREAGIEERLAAEDLDEAELEQRWEEELGALADRLPTDRERVIEMRVLTEAGRLYAGAAGLPVGEPAPAHVAEDLGLDPENAYAQVVAGFFAVMDVLEQRADPVQPTEADQREVYDRLVAEGLTRTPFEEAKEVLTTELIGGPVAMRNLLVELVDQAEVRVNPKYELVYQVAVPLGEGSTWLAVPLGG